MSKLEREFEGQEMTLLASRMTRKEKMRIQRAHAAIVALKRCGYLPKGVA